MIALYILLGLLLSLLLILLCPIHLTVRYEGNVRFTLSVLGIPIIRYPKKEKISIKAYSKAAIKKRNKRLAKKEEKKKKHAATHKKKSIADILRAVKLILRILKRTYPKLIFAFRIRVCELRAVVATDDAAKTAILYGTVSQGFAYILALCEEFLWCKRSKKRVSVVPDFCGTETSLQVKIRFTTQPFRLLRLGVAAGMMFLKEKAKEKNTTVQTKGEKNNG